MIYKNQVYEVLTHNTQSCEHHQLHENETVPYVV